MTDGAAPGGADRAGRAGTGLLDRAGELEAIRRALQQARDEKGGTIAVLGAAGMGKTALLRCSREDAKDAGFRVLEARGEFLERDFPWERFGACFRAPAASGAARRDWPAFRCAGRSVRAARCSLPCTACTG